MKTADYADRINRRFTQITQIAFFDSPQITQIYADYLFRFTADYADSRETEPFEFSILNSQFREAAKDLFNSEF